MAIRQRGAGFQVDVTYRDKRARVNVATMAEARQKERDYRALLKAGEPIPVQTDAAPARLVPSEHTIGYALELTDKLRWRGNKDSTGSYRCGTEWCTSLGFQFPVEDITGAVVAPVIEAWEARGQSAGTINRKLAALSAMLKTMAANGKLTTLPILPRRKEYEGRIRWFTEAEERSLLEFAGDREVQDCIVLSIDTGIRRGELMRLTVRDTDRAERPSVTVWETKGDKPRTLPLTTRAAAALKRLTDCRADHDRVVPERINETHLSRVVSNWRAKMRLPDRDEACWHSLRHTCASRLVQRGVPIVVVKEWMGHASIQTTMRYAHLAPDSLSMAHIALEGRMETRIGIEPMCLDLQSSASTTPPTRHPAVAYRNPAEEATR